MDNLKARISIRLSRPIRIPWLLLFLLAAACGGGTTGESGELLIRTAGFAFPSLASVMPAIISNQGLDRKHGLRMEVHPYGSVAAYYAGLAVGEVDTLPGGPIVLQRMRSEGVPIRVVATYATLASLLVIASDPSLRALEDLKGKKLAADMSSSEFHILRLIAAWRGLDLASQVGVIQAVPSVAQAHLQSGEADAILTFEPAATLALRENPDYRVILKGEEAWREFSGRNGWLLVSLMRENWIDRHPDGVEKWLSALGDAEQFMIRDPEESDRIVAEALGLPVGLFLQAREAGRIHFEIQPAGRQKEALNRMFEAAVKSGYAEELPDSGVFYEQE